MLNHAEPWAVKTSCCVLAAVIIQRKKLRKRRENTGYGLAYLHSKRVIWHVIFSESNEGL